MGAYVFRFDPLFLTDTSFTCLLTWLSFPSLWRKLCVSTFRPKDATAVKLLNHSLLLARVTAETAATAATAKAVTPTAHPI